MAGKIQAKQIDTKQKAYQVVKAFKDYLNEHAELEKEYTRIPNWRHFKQMKNIRKREKLTRQYKLRMFELGVLV